MRIIWLGMGILISAGSGAATFSMNDATIQANFLGTFTVTGSASLSSGESLIPPASSSSIWNAFLSSMTAGFDADVELHSDFLAWNGGSPYSGNILRIGVSPLNFGYNNGMPGGLYGSNPGGPNGEPGVRFSYRDASNELQAAIATYRITVVPEPATLLAMATGITALFNRRKATK